MGLRRSFKPTNLVKNGNFTNGDIASFEIINLNVLSVTNNVVAFIATFQYGVFRQVLPFVDGHKYYFSGSVKASSSNVKFGLWSNYGGYQISHSGGGQFEKLSNIGTYVDATMSTQKNIFIGDNSPSGWKEVRGKELLLIDLTALFGAGNEPDKAWCDLNIPVWFDGILGSGVINGTGGLK